MVQSIINEDLICCCLKRDEVMEESQFDEVKSLIDLIETNTSGAWDNNEELKKLNEKAGVILSILDENNELLRELISVIKNQKG